MDPTTRKEHDDLDDLFCKSTEEAAELLLSGQEKILQGNLEEGVQLFEKASQLKPDDPKLYFEQGLSLFDLGSEEGQIKTLLLASKKFKTATTLFPEYPEAWYFWGTTLSLLGKLSSEFHYMVEAESRLRKALEHSHPIEIDFLHDLHAEYGNVKAALAKHSGEACDWQAAIEAFEKAAKLPNAKAPSFWNQFGLAYLALTALINDVKLCVKAIHYFESAVSQDSTYYEGWKNLATAICFLYSRTHDEDHFHQGNECFNSCSQLHPLDADIWLSWALFLLESAYVTQDSKRLHACMEKCTRAYSLNPHLTEVLACWGEALARAGERSELIEKIHEGQSKILEALDLNPEIPFAWRALGESYNCFARYFREDDYHYQAIEKFQEGLSLDRSRHELWFAIAATYTQIGKNLSDTDTLEKALRFYEKAIYLKPGTSTYHFHYGHCLSKLGELTQENNWLELSLVELEKALQIQKNAVYIHPDWLFEYARTLDLHANFFDEEMHYHRAIEIFSHVLMIDPDFPEIHYQLALTHSHLGELSESLDSFYKSLHFFKLAAKHNPEDDNILLNLGVTLINIAQYTEDEEEARACYQDAELKLTQAAKAGNLQAYYQLACLFSLQGDLEKSLSFLLKADSFNALPYTEDILEDEWLDRLKGSTAFGELMHYLEKKESLQEDF